MFRSIGNLFIHWSEEDVIIMPRFDFIGYVWIVLSFDTGMNYYKNRIKESKISWSIYLYKIQIIGYPQKHSIPKSKHIHVQFKLLNKQTSSIDSLNVNTLCIIFFANYVSIKLWIYYSIFVSIF